MRWTEAVAARQRWEFNRTLDLFSNFNEGIDTWSTEPQSQQVQLCLAYRCWCAAVAPSARLTLAALRCRCLVSLHIYIKSIFAQVPRAFYKVGVSRLLLSPMWQCLLLEETSRWRYFLVFVGLDSCLVPMKRGRQIKAIRPATALCPSWVRVFRLLSGLCNMTPATKAQQCWTDTEL